MLGHESALARAQVLLLRPGEAEAKRRLPFRDRAPGVIQARAIAESAAGSRGIIQRETERSMNKKRKVKTVTQQYDYSVRACSIGCFIEKSIASPGIGYFKPVAQLNNSTDRHPASRPRAAAFCRPAAVAAPSGQSKMP